MSNYQKTLMFQRESTNIISSSYTILYKGFYIHGANYNGVHICHTYLTCENCYYSKSIEQVKKTICGFKNIQQTKQD